MTLLILPPNFKVHKNSCLLFPRTSSQDNVNTRPPNSAKIQPVPPNAGSTGLPAICRACVAQGGKPEGVSEGSRCGDLEGLSLAARHCETFQPSRRTRTSAREPCLLRFHPGSTSGTARKQLGPSRRCHPLLCTWATGLQLENHSLQQEAWGPEARMWLLRGHNSQQLPFLANPLP